MYKTSKTDKAKCTAMPNNNNWRYNMKVKINSGCISCETCVSICPDVFKIGDEGHACVKCETVPKEHEIAVLDAVESCPVNVIESD